MTKTQQISALILAATKANGGDIQKGFDAVFGEGAYMALASTVYHQLRGEA